MNRKVVAALLSGLVCPGAGQLYNGQRVKGGALMAAVLVILALLFHETWGALYDMLMSMPPEEALSDPFGLARRVIEHDKAFYDRATVALGAAWVYGMVDAYVCGGRRGRLV